MMTSLGNSARPSSVKPQTKLQTSELVGRPLRSSIVTSRQTRRRLGFRLYRLLQRKNAAELQHMPARYIALCFFALFRSDSGPLRKQVTKIFSILISLDVRATSVSYLSNLKRTSSKHSIVNLQASIVSLQLALDSVADLNF